MLPLCLYEEIADGEARGFAVEGPALAQRLIVVRRAGRVYGYVNVCPHAMSRLDHTPGNFLDRDDDRLHCDGHGALFRVEDGVCTAGPCLGDALRPAPVVVRDGMICFERDGVALVDEISKFLSDLD